MPHMKILITGSSGHLGEALMRTLANGPHEAVGVDILRSPFTNISGLHRGSRRRRCLHERRGRGVARRDAAQATRGHASPPGLRRHEHHGHAQPARGRGGEPRALVRVHQHHQHVRRRAHAATRARPPPGSPKTWCRSRRTSTARPRLRPKTCASCFIGISNCPASCCALRGSFPKTMTWPEKRAAFEDANLKANEFLYRRVDVEDVVSAHLLAMEKAPQLGLRQVHHHRDYAVHA